MDYIEQHAIYQLILKKSCRYRDMKPKDIEGNRFSYHLHKLQTDGLIKKEGHNYSLTAQGLHLADTLSLKSLQPRIQPKIVTLIACKNKDGEWLLYKRAREPFYGLVGFPYGKLHLGETVHQAAARELEEKTGVKAELKMVGNAYITIWDHETVISQMFCHVFLGRPITKTLLTSSQIGQCFWSKTDSHYQYIPGFTQIKKLIEKGEPSFFAEIVVNYSSSN